MLLGFIPHIVELTDQCQGVLVPLVQELDNSRNLVSSDLRLRIDSIHSRRWQCIIYLIRVDGPYQIVCENYKCHACHDDKSTRHALPPSPWSNSTVVHSPLHAYGLLQPYSAHCSATGMINHVHCHASSSPGDASPWQHSIDPLMGRSGSRAWRGSASKSLTSGKRSRRTQSRGWGKN